MDFLKFLSENIVFFDGGTGTLLQNAGLLSGEPTENFNIHNPDELVKIHRAYFDAGSNVVVTNTFGVNGLKYSDSEVQTLVSSAVSNIKKAISLSNGKQEKFTALDIGPLGRLLKPLGDLEFEDAVNAFASAVRAGVTAGVDLIYIETMNDLYETKAAVLAAKENSDLPIVVSNAYGEDCRLMSGATPETTVALLESLGVDVIGVNCSFGPKMLTPIVKKYLEIASVPVLFKPNAGLPEVKDGKTVYSETPKQFAEDILPSVDMGVRCVGGCCGTTPEYIKELKCALSGKKPKNITFNDKTVITSGIKCVEFGETPVLIGERINPTGKKRLKEALKSNDINYILNEGIAQAEKGADVLDVNVGAPEIDEPCLLPATVKELQAVCDLPLQIDTSDFSAMENAMRVYNGKPLVNSVNGKKESMERVFPLVKKYGGAVIALTLDENGIPNTAEERLEIAKRILKRANDFNIDKKDIIFDPLTLTVSADTSAANTTIKSVELINKELNCKTSLGVSNVSFGLPNRSNINSVFFAAALEHGLSAAIINPFSDEIMRTYHTWALIHGKDKNCLSYINFEENHTVLQKTSASEEICDLKTAILKGLKERSFKITEQLLKSKSPLEIINDEIIPALNTVGELFESKKVFLPQLLMSAEAASSAFEVIKYNSTNETPQNAYPIKIILATVKGDIHDIGKNIVKLLLENYGFNVSDLGKDVEPQKIVNTAKELNADLVGLSALMTTTVPAMEETIKLLKLNLPKCKVVVGGAVLTKEFADRIGADRYAKDALETVRYAQEISK